MYKGVVGVGVNGHRLYATSQNLVANVRN